MFCHPISGLNHPKIPSYVDVLRRDANVRNRVAIIVERGDRVLHKEEDVGLGVDGTNEAMSEDASAVPSQMRIGRRKKQQ